MQKSSVLPHGDKLVNLFVDEKEKSDLIAQSVNWPSLDLTPRQLCDLELLLNGGFSPLTSFLGQADYESVCTSMRLQSGIIWPMPIVLDVSEDFAASIGKGQTLALRDPEGVLLAALTISEIYKPDRSLEAKSVFGTTSTDHPGVNYVLNQNKPYYISGTLKGLELPKHYDFSHLRATPAQIREEFQQMGWRRIVAFQTRNPMHRAHFELTMRAARECDANILVQPVVGMTKPGDVDHYTRVRCYEAVFRQYLPGVAKLAVLPLAMRMGGPREAVWHSLIRKNFGCTHFIVGRDHAGPGVDSKGKPFYEPYAAQELMKAHEEELGIKMVPFNEMVFLPDQDRYVQQSEVPKDAKISSISGTELRRKLSLGQEIPAWFTFPEVAKELTRTYPPRAQQGFTVFFTGLSGSGKSTIANALLIKLLEIGGRSVTLLDGDLVRKHLSSELGFSKEHRDINIRRIGFVAAEITKGGGVAICAPIAPYNATRAEVKNMVSPNGGFVLVHIATALEVCEQRDRKGLYKKARAGILKEFTGISDTYEAPTDADIVLDTVAMTPEEEAHKIILHLVKEGFIESASK